MFGIGFFELVVIAVVALVFVGPKKLPDVMKQAGRLFVQVRRSANDVKGTFDQVIRDAEDEIRREEAAAMRNLLTGSSPPSTAAAVTTAHVTASNLTASNVTGSNDVTVAHTPTANVDVMHRDGHPHDRHHQATTTHGTASDGSLAAPDGATAFDPHAATTAKAPQPTSPAETSEPPKATTKDG